MDLKNNSSSELANDLTSIIIRLEKIHRILDQKKKESIDMQFNDKLVNLTRKKESLQPLVKCIGWWIVTTILFFIGAFLLQFLPEYILAYMDKISSWITFIAIIACGLTAGTAAYKHNKAIGKLIIIAWASIGACYFGYVAEDYGSNHPHVSAIGFNIATTLQSIAILVISFAGLIAFINYIFKAKLDVDE